MFQEKSHHFICKKKTERERPLFEIWQYPPKNENGQTYL